MAKDYTDYIALILDSGERVYHLEHFRHGKLHPLDNKVHSFNGHEYLLELDRAYRIKWTPWSKVIWAEPKTIEHQEHWYFKGDNRLWARKTVTVQEVKKPLVKLRPLATLNEFIRSKKIGLLLYQEPPPPRQVERVFDCECSCGFKGKNMTGTKVHVAGAGEGHTLIEEKEIEFVGRVKEPIEPMHISRIHQPSGELRG